MTRELIILLYHHVGRPSPETSMRGLYVTPRHLAWQIRQLQRFGVRFVTCRDLTGDLGRDPDSRHWVMITFDDGTRGLYDQALPVLQDARVPAVVYPIVSVIGKTHVVSEHSSDKTPHDMLSGNQIREMARLGIEFGSHLCHHVRANELPPHELAIELFESKRLLEALIGQSVLSVAYPYGQYSPDVMRAARTAGYRFGLTTRRGSNKGRDEMSLCREPVKGTRWHHYLYFWRLLRSLRRPAGGT